MRGILPRASNWLEWSDDSERAWRKQTRPRRVAFILLSRAKALARRPRQRRRGVASSAPYVDPLREPLERLARAELSQPGIVLGPHPVDRGEDKALAIRTIQPTAIEVRVQLTEGGEEFPATRIHSAGIFEAILPATAAVRAIPGGYRFRVRYDDGSVAQLHDPYNFPPLLTDFDLYLIGEGYASRRIRKAGRACARDRGRARRALRRVGAERVARERGGRFQPLGRTRAPFAAAGKFGLVGILCAARRSKA